jgi:hypothetical protein
MRSAREVEDAVRHHAWPAPPSQLRNRVLAEARLAEPRRQFDGPDKGTLPAQRRWQRHAAVVLIASIVLTFGACTGADVWADRQVEAEVARLERVYGSLALETMNVPAVPGDDNRADIARAAAALTVQPTSTQRNALAQMHKATMMPPNLVAFAQVNDAAVRHAAGIRARGQANWNVDYARDAGGPSNWPVDVDRPAGDRPDYLVIRALSDAIWVSALGDIDAGRFDDAAIKNSSGLALAASLRQEPEVLAQLIRIAIVHRQIAGLQRLLATAEPSGAALDDVAKWLAENRIVDPMRVGPIGELKQAHALFARMEHGDVDRRMLQALFPISLSKLPEAWLGPIARIGRPLVRLAHARYLRQMDEMLEAQAGPRPRPAWPQIETPRWWDPSYRFVSHFRAGIRRSIESGDDFYSELGLAEIAVALRRYRLDHGAYPDGLGAIVPRYMPSIPVDPYAGRPPAYSRLTSGFTLHAGPGRPETDARLLREWNVSR